MATNTEIEDQRAFEIFARLHPVEAYEMDAERFIAFAQRVTGASREDIINELPTKERSNVSE